MSSLSRSLHELKGGCWGSYAIAPFSPDGKILATADDCSIPSVCLWDVSSGERLSGGNSKVTDIRALAWLRDGRLATFREDGFREEGEILFWGESGSLVRTLKLGPTSSAYYLHSFSPGGDILARGWLTSIWFNQVTTGRSLGVWLAWISLTGTRYMTIAPDGSFYSSAPVERDLVCVVQTENGQETLSLDQFSAKYGWKNHPEHVLPVYEVTD